MIEIIKIDPQNPNHTILQKAVDTLQKGGVIIYPTDTAYGLGANALSENAIRKVYEIKGRGPAKPTHVIVRDWEMIKELCEENEIAKALYDHFLPGPLTLILKKHPIVPDNLTANLPTLGIRIPNYSVTKLLSKSVPFPYTTPSANLSGGNTSYSIDSAFSQFSKKQKRLIDLVLDAGLLPSNPPSTIIDTTAQSPKIVREGPITQEEIEKVLGIRVK